MLLRTVNSDKFKQVLTVNMVLVILLLGTLSLLIMTYSKNSTIKNQLLTSHSPVVITMIIGEAPKPVAVTSVDTIDDTEVSVKPIPIMAQPMKSMEVIR